MRAPRRQSESGPLRKVWTQLNLLLDYIQCLRPVPAPGYQLRWTNKGWSLVPRGKSTTQEIEGSGVEWMVVKGVGTNHLDCRRLSDDTAAYSQIKVLKPLNICPDAIAKGNWGTLQFSGRSNTLAQTASSARTHSVGADATTTLSVDELVWPPYGVETGDPVAQPEFQTLLLARKLPSNSPLFFTSDYKLAKSEATGAIRVQYIDTNEVFCRQWVMRLEPYKVCQDEVLYWAPFYAGRTTVITT